MTVETALRTRLLADSGLAGLIDARLYVLVAPPGAAMPYAVLQRVSGRRDHTLAGPSGWAQTRVQLGCWARTWLAAKAIADAVRVSLDGYRGTLSGVAIFGLTSDNEVALYDDTDGTGRHGVVIDFVISHDE